MIIIQCAGHESALVCKSFFNHRRKKAPDLSAQLTGLAASLNALEHYPPGEAEASGIRAARVIAGE